jgi:hypothetical protein
MNCHMVTYWRIWRWVYEPQEEVAERHEDKTLSILNSGVRSSSRSSIFNPSLQRQLHWRLVGSQSLTRCNGEEENPFPCLESKLGHRTNSSSSNALNLHSGVTHLESWPEHWLSQLRVSVISSVTPENAGQYIDQGKAILFPNTSWFIIHESPFHSTQCRLRWGKISH